MEQRWDAIVVGGGPSGSTAARRLAAAGARTLLLEKASHPRYKACGGGVPVRAARHLDGPIDAVVEDAVDTIEVSHFGRRSFSKRSPRPFAYMVMRDRFDRLLVEGAEAAGATVHQDEAVTNVEVADGLARVTTAGGAYQTQFVVGADGTTGVVGRTLGLAQRLPTSAAWEVEFHAPSAALERWRGRANVDIGYRPWGYGWVFPKDGKLSVGVVLAPGQGRNIRLWTEQYAERLGLGGATIAIAKGHPVHFRRRAERIAAGPALLVGDAAGLADEFTAEGISYALHSGRLAAAAVLAELGAPDASADGDAASRYQTMVNREIQPELDAARAISRMYHRCVTTWPGLAFAASRRLDYLWSAFFRVMRGDSSYDRELARMPGLALSKRIF